MLTDDDDTESAGEGGGIFWADTRESDQYYKLYGEECVPDGTLALGESCLFGDESCAAGLVCHSGYEPDQCRPQSELGGPCGRRDDCARGSCEYPDILPLEEFASLTCARADPSCDIRVDPTCNRWLSCGECR